MARIKDLTQATPNKDDVVVIDGGNGVHKVPLGDLAGIVGTTGIAGFHNSIYRGKDITAYHEDGTLYERISSGTFDDLFVGDYFTITITTEYGTETVDCVLAGFDIYPYMTLYDAANDESGDRLPHHAVCITRDKFRTGHRIQPSGVSYDGYYQTELHTTTLPKYANAMKTVMGDHLLEVCDYYSYDINDEYVNVNYQGLTGCTDGADYNTSDFHTHLIPLTERELYGAPAYSCSPYEVGWETSQLPLFRLNPAMKAIGNWYWLKDYAGSGRFCSCGGNGYPSYGIAGGTFGVRPRFIIG